MLIKCVSRYFALLYKEDAWMAKDFTNLIPGEQCVVQVRAILR